MRGLNSEDTWSIQVDISEKKVLFEDVADISSALERIYKYPEDRFILEINDYRIELPIVYGVSDLLDDFIYILQSLQEKSKGEEVYGFSQNDYFDGDWKIKWDESDLTIDFEWRFLKENNNKVPNSITLRKQEFLNSWFGALNELVETLNFELLDDTDGYYYIIQNRC